MNTKKQQPSVTLVLGGARSGKTGWAEALATDLAAGHPGSAKPVYLATARAADDEMKARIKRHRQLRGERFETIEEPEAIAEIISGRGAGEVLLVDSIGAWITNLMLAGADIGAACDNLVEAASSCRADCVLVSEEAGLGIVPDNAMAREFGDRIGELNQRLAALADRVVLLVAGIPMVLKDKGGRAP